MLYLTFTCGAGRTERTSPLGEGASNFLQGCKLSKDGRIQANELCRISYNLFLYSTDSRIRHLLVLQLPEFTAGLLACFVKGQLFSTDMRDHKLFNLKHRQARLKCQMGVRQTLGGNIVAVTHKYIWVQALIFLLIFVVYLFSWLDLKNLENKRSETGIN